MTTILAVAIGGLIFSGVVIFGYIKEKDRLLINQRLKRLTKEKKSRPEKQLKQKQTKKQTILDGNDENPLVRKVAAELETAGILLRAKEFLVGWLSLAIIPVLILLAFRASVLTIIAIATVAGALPPILVKQAQNKRKKLFNKQLGEALVIIANCLRAGFTFTQAMESITQDMPDPINREFMKTVREIKLGVAMETALGNMVKRTQNTDVELLVSAVLVQKQVGGNLANIIETIADTIKERIRIKGEVQVLTASGRISGMIIGLLPVLLMVLFLVINPDYMMQFFNTQIGMIMLAVAVVMEVIGFLFVQKIVDIKY